MPPASRPRAIPPPLVAEAELDRLREASDEARTGQGRGLERGGKPGSADRGSSPSSAGIGSAIRTVRRDPFGSFSAFPAATAVRCTPSSIHCTTGSGATPPGRPPRGRGGRDLPARRRRPAEPGSRRGVAFLSGSPGVSALADRPAEEVKRLALDATFDVLAPRPAAGPRHRPRGHPLGRYRDPGPDRRGGRADRGVARPHPPHHPAGRRGGRGQDGPGAAQCRDPVAAAPGRRGGAAPDRRPVGRSPAGPRRLRAPQERRRPALRGGSSSSSSRSAFRTGPARSGTGTGRARSGIDSLQDLLSARLAGSGGRGASPRWPASSDGNSGPVSWPASSTATPPVCPWRTPLPNCSRPASSAPTRTTATPATVPARPPPGGGL